LAIVSQPAESHPFRIHQVDFVAYAENGIPLAHPAWLDRSMFYGTSVDVVLDLPAPVTMGHARISLSSSQLREQGMMAKILFKQ
jgi:hypothetical protein